MARDERNHALEEALARLIPTYRYSPSYTELAEAVGSPRGPVFRAVLRLERDGRVELAGPQRRICVR